MPHHFFQLLKLEIFTETQPKDYGVITDSLENIVTNADEIQEEILSAFVKVF